MLLICCWRELMRMVMMKRMKMLLHSFKINLLDDIHSSPQKVFSRVEVTCPSYLCVDDVNLVPFYHSCAVNFSTRAFLFQHQFSLQHFDWVNAKMACCFSFFFPLRCLLRDILFDSWTQEKHVEIEWLWFACCGVANVKKVSCCFEPCCWVTLMTNMMGKLSLCCRVERKGRTSAKEWWEESGPRSWARFFASAAIMRNFLCFVLQRQRVWTGSWATPAPTSSDIFRRWRKIATLSFLELLYCVFWRK